MNKVERNRKTNYLKRLNNINNDLSTMKVMVDEDIREDVTKSKEHLEKAIEKLVEQLESEEDE